MRQSREQRVGADLRPDSLDADKSQAAAEELRRPTFIGDDVRLAMAEYRPPGWRELRQREGIRRRSSRHKEHGDLVLEHVRELLLQAGGDLVIPITGSEPPTDLSDGVQNPGGDPGGIVAREIHPHPRSKPLCREFISQGRLRWAKTLSRRCTSGKFVILLSVRDRSTAGEVGATAK